jgi:hypothetical protein
MLGMLSSVVIDTLNLLTFRLSRERFLAFGRWHLAFGLGCTWLAGVGRYWDNPEASILQHLGVGSIVYIFILALVLLFFISPLWSDGLSYFRVLTFLALVSPPAILYAIPVEKFVDIATANGINAWFLIIVATWRVWLLLYFMIHLLSMKPMAAISASLLPISIIVLVLVFLNLEHAVFNIMGGITTPTPNDASYNVLLFVLVLAVLTFPVTVITYIVSIVKAGRAGDDEKFDLKG